MYNRPEMTIFPVMLFIFSGVITIVQAQPYDLYMSGNAGIGMMRDADLTDTTDPDFLFDLGYENDLALSGAIGLIGGQYRSELEFSHQKNDLNNVEFMGVEIDPALAGLSGDTSLNSGLVNAYYDFETRFTRVSPYISGGMGFASADLQFSFDDGVSQESVSDDDTVFAYQLGAGIGFAVTDMITIDLRYRYFSASKLELDTTRFKLSSHNILTGVRINF